MSTTIALRFLAGRYHGTPWGEHVNEAGVEWPPSPWRLLRALLAVWHRKADADEIPEEVMRHLVLALAAERPHYRLPPANSGHTRQYMPVPKGRGQTTTLVFDGFLAVDPDEPLVVSWPTLTLVPRLREALALLVARLGYLGRAESWVDGAIVDQWDGEVNCLPLEAAGELERGEEIRIKVPEDPERYRGWRAAEVESRKLDRARLKVSEKRLLETLPEDLFAALQLETGIVRGQGWSSAPGSTEARYWWRPARSALPVQVHGASRRIDTIRFGLVGKPLPLIEDAIRIGEVVRLALIRKVDDLSDADAEVPPVVSGHGMGGDNVHGHAFYLPEDSDGDGRIDHVLVHADEGLGQEVLAAAGRLKRIWLDGGREWGLLLDSYGTRDDFPGLPLLGKGTAWVSVTPYLHPWHVKRSFSVEDQIRRECRLRGLPDPDIERLDHIFIRSRDRRPVHFHRFRSRKRRRSVQPDRMGSFWRLRFPVAIAGPLALGTHCHFGLGMFRREA